MLFVLEGVFAIHEYGHLREFQHLNIPVEEFSLGIGWKLYQFEGEEYDVTIRAIPLAAYVAPTQEGHEILIRDRNAWEQSVIYTAGVRNNLAVGLVLVFLMQWLGYRRGNLTRAELVRTMLITPLTAGMRLGAFIVGCATFGKVDYGYRYLISTGGIAPSPFLRFFVSISLLLGLVNIIPIMPLDGGRLALATALPLILSENGLIVYRAICTMLFIPFLISINIVDYRILECELVERTVCPEHDTELHADVVDVPCCLTPEHRQTNHGKPAP